MRYIIRVSKQKSDPSKTWYEVRDTVRRNVKGQPRLMCKCKELAKSERDMAVLERKNGSG